MGGNQGKKGIRVRRAEGQEGYKGKKGTRVRRVGEKGIGVRRVRIGRV